MAIVKVIVSNKLIQRAQPVKDNNVLEFVEADQLWDEYGGNRKYNPEGTLYIKKLIILFCLKIARYFHHFTFFIFLLTLFFNIIIIIIFLNYRISSKVKRVFRFHQFMIQIFQKYYFYLFFKLNVNDKFQFFHAQQDFSAMNPI